MRVVMNRIAWALAGLAVLWARPSFGDGAERPNFIFLFADDLGWGDMGAYGHPRIRTPHLDQLAAEGILFTQGYMPSSVCSPSRAGALTGLFPARLGMHAHLVGDSAQNVERGMVNYLDPAVPTLPRTLQEHGYVTGHVGKWHLGGTADAPTLDQYGFDWYRHTHGPASHFNAISRAYRAHASEWFADAAIAFLQEHGDQPFYLNLWFTHPHATATEPTDEQMQPYQHLRWQRLESDWPGAQVIYYAVVSELDRQIGRVLEKLDALGLRENTVVIFSSDNGPEDVFITNASHAGVGSAGPFRGRKRSLYEGGIRVPFLVRWPGHAPAGLVNDVSAVNVVDLYPTVCRLAGVPFPDGLDGEDMSASWRGALEPRTKPMFWEWRFGVVGHVLHRSPMLAIRDGDWKLLCNPEADRVELYRIPEDPSEWNNLVEVYPDVADRLKDRVLIWQQELPEGPWDPDAGNADYPWPSSLAAGD